MRQSKSAVLFENQPSLRQQLSEDELDWQENQRRSDEDRRHADRAFLTGWAGVTAMWIALAIVASGAMGAAHIVALWAQH